MEEIQQTMTDNTLCYIIKNSSFFIKCPYFFKTFPKFTFRFPIITEFYPMWHIQNQSLVRALSRTLKI